MLCYAVLRERTPKRVLDHIARPRRQPLEVRFGHLHTADRSVVHTAQATRLVARPRGDAPKLGQPPRRQLPLHDGHIVDGDEAVTGDGVGVDRA